MSTIRIPYRILAIAGHQQSGKDTLARLMQQSAIETEQFRIINFSDVIAATCSREFNIELPTLADPVLKETLIPRLNNRSPRDLMRIVGDAFRRVDEDYLCHRVSEHITKALFFTRQSRGHSSATMTFVIPGVRMLREAKFLTENLLATVVGVRRSSSFAGDRDVTESEREVEDVISKYATYVVNNEFDIQHLTSHAAHLMETTKFRTD